MEGHAIGGHGRHPKQGQLQRDRARGGERRVAGGHQTVALFGEDPDIQPALILQEAAFVQQAPLDGRGLGQQKHRSFCLRGLGVQPGRGGQKGRQQALDLPSPAARHDAHDRPLCGKVQIRQKLRARHFRMHAVQERMAHEAGLIAVSRVQFRLKGQDHGHAVCQAADAVHPLLAPGPDLRADIVQNRNAQFFGEAGQQEIEVRIVDENEQLRPPGPHPRGQRTSGPQDVGQPAQDLHQAHDREPGRIGQQFHAGAGHFPTAHATETEFRPQGFQLRHQCRTVHVARGLAGHNHDFRSAVRGQGGHGLDAQGRMVACCRKAQSLKPAACMVWLSSW